MVRIWDKNSSAFLREIMACDILKVARGVAEAGIDKPWRRNRQLSHLPQASPSSVTW